MDKNEFFKYLEDRGIQITDEIYENCHDFMHAVLEENKKFNLTAITEINDFEIKMILDSALGLANTNLSDKKVLDIGTGAGFPGMILYLFNKNVQLTLLDSTEKKINFLRSYSSKHNFNINCISERAEIFASNNKEKFDYVYARAVASLNILLELALPMIKVGGYFVALKGPESEREINDSIKAMNKLNCHVSKIYSDYLPNGEERKIIYIQKDKQTNPKYPREYSEIKKKPL